MRTPGRGGMGPSQGVLLVGHLPTEMSRSLRRLSFPTQVIGYRKKSQNDPNQTNKKVLVSILRLEDNWGPLEQDL